MSDTIHEPQVIPSIPAEALVMDALSRLLNRKTGLRRDLCRDIAMQAVYGALSDAKVAQCR